MPQSVEGRIEANKRVIGLLAPELQKHHLLELQGNRYMRVAGGIALAQALGFTISVHDVQRSEDADGVWFACRAELKDVISGLTLAEATGYVGMDEKRWATAPRFARMSMCQTRAIAKLCRSNFGAMYTLLGATKDTPAEEMEGLPREAASTAQPAITEPPAMRSTPARRAAPEPLEGVYGEAIEVDDIDEKEGKKGTYLRVKAAGSPWMSCFDKDAMETIRNAHTKRGYVQFLIETHPQFGGTIIGAKTAAAPEDVPF